MGRVRNWLSYLATPVPHHLRRMGYVRELVALGARQDRCQAAWASHLEHTRGVILAAAAHCQQRRKAVILGSGLWFDIPVAELSSQFQQVVLVDIVHLWRVQRRAAAFANVRLLAHDVTGVVQPSYRLARRRRPAPLPCCQPDCSLHNDADLLVSANIVSQLPVLPNAYLARRVPLSDGQLAAFSRTLVENHLDWISSCRGVVALIADLERLHCNDAGAVGREASLWGVSLPAGGEEWYWDLAPRPEIEFHLDVRHRVTGYAVFPKQAWRAGRRATGDAGSGDQAGATR